MAIIEKSTYDDLIKLQNNLTTSEKETSSMVERLTVDIAEQEAFLANYDTTFKSLQDSVDALDVSITAIETQEAQLSKDLEDEEDRLSQLKDEREDLIEKRKISEEEGDTEKVAIIDARLAENHQEQDALGLSIDKNKNKLTQLKTTKAESAKSKDGLQNQIEDNEQKKKQLEDGGLQELKDELAAETEKLTKITAELKSLNDNSGQIILAYQAQQVARDENIKAVSRESIVNNPPANHVTLKKESDVLKATVDALMVDLPSSVREAITVVSEKPNFIKADEAITMTLESFYNVDLIMDQIKRAAENGLYEVFIAEMPLTIAYVLIENGYNLRLSTVIGESSVVDVIVSWQDLGGNS